MQKIQMEEILSSQKITHQLRLMNIMETIFGQMKPDCSEYEYQFGRNDKDFACCCS